MSYFNPAFLQFFVELASNNNTTWFNANRKTYEKEVKEPFTRLVTEMISRIRKYEPDVQIKPADAIMRINNDIRFSKDKTPYKLHICANISPFGKRNLGYPGFFFQLSPENVTIYGGVYMVDNPTLFKIRCFIAAHTPELQAVTGDPAFVKKYGSIQGEKNKRIPPEFLEILKTEPLIANKQFYYGATLPTDTITRPDIPDVLLEYYLVAKGVNSFFQKAMKN